MILTKKGIERIYLFTLILGGLLYILCSGLLAYEQSNNIQLGVSDRLISVFRVIFIIASLLYFKIRMSKAGELNIIPVLWREFIFAALLMIVYSCISLVLSFFGDSALGKSIVINNMAYAIISSLCLLYFSRLFYSWRRFILFLRTQQLVLHWRIYEGLMFALAVFSAVISFHGFAILSLVIFTAIALYFSVNLKWVAYLSYKQKLQSIALLFLILLIIAAFVSYFFNNYNADQAEYKIMADIYFIAISVFSGIYAISALLVLIFNLPTSSVFEQKMGEVLNFQELSDSLQMGSDEVQIYNTLLNTCVNSSGADVAWISYQVFPSLSLKS